MFKFSSSTEFMRRSLALAAVLGASVAVLGAQTVSQSGTQPDAQSATAVQAQQPLTVQAPSVDTAGDALFSSSSAENEAAGSGSGTQQASLRPLPVNFAEAMQYGGGRRRYGSPRYRGNNTNADGSSKWIFFGGGGLAQPVGNTWKYLTPSWGIQVGGGRQFSRHFAVPIEFDYDHFGFTGQTLSNQSLLYFSDPNPADNGLDGSSHVWSFSVDPMYTLRNGDSGGFGAYVVAGVGFYHKVANFTVPQQEEYCDPYYGFCQPIEVNGTFDHYSANAPGFSGGFGLTYKLSHFASERLYAEVRYVLVANSQRQGFTAANETTTTYHGYDYYPANSNRTTYFPVKFGIRF